MSTDPISVRVARRHQAALVVREVPTVKKRLEFTDSGRISALDVMNMLEAQFGYIVRLRFQASPGGEATSVGWVAVNENGDAISGKLVIHAAVADDEVMSWGRADGRSGAVRGRRSPLRRRRDPPSLTPEPSVSCMIGCSPTRPGGPPPLA